MKNTLTLLGGACLLALSSGMAQAEITTQMLADPPAEDWLTASRTLDGHRHSPLDQITPDNVKGLQLVWARGMEPGPVQVTPIVHQGVMYLINPGDVIQAIDATSGDLLWEHRRALADRLTLNTLGERSRSLSLYGDKVYFVSWDNHLIALNMADGQVAFDIDRGQGAEGISASSGPIIAGNTLVAGSTCQMSAFGCYVTGHDLATGEELWRNYFIPKPGEEGDETWGNDFESRWMTGSWGQLSYDPQTDLVFYGSTAVGPANEIQRGTPGGTMYGTNTRFAVRPSTGEIVWRHQTLPRDNWDQECTFEMIIATTDVTPAADMDGVLAVSPNASGEARRVLTGVPCKTGTMWQFDAETGEFLWARDTVVQNMIESVDTLTGEVKVNEAQIFTSLEQTVSHCPSFLGGRNWPGTSFNQSTGTYFIPLINTCADTKAQEGEFTAADVYNIERVEYITPGKENIGRIDAIDIATGKTLWSYEQPAANYSGLMTTSSGLLFMGTTDRYFRALSQETGEVLWQTRLASVASGQPMTFAVDGVQYVAMAGGGISLANRFNVNLPQSVDATAIGSAVYVFALPQ